jgi:NAD(P)-dependent dehydrogenase (short-subunit alcohol dehydrogenase family)
VTVKDVEAHDRRIVAAQVDTRDAAALREAVDAGVAELGKLDVIVANAGICILRAWDEVTPEIWRDTIDINLTGTWNTLMAGAPHLVAAGGGSIIVTSSAAGLKGLPFLSPYVASKFALTGLTRSFAAELAEHNIRVNSIHPTGVNTPMVSGDALGNMPDLLAKHPRLTGMFTNTMPVEATEPSDISNAVLFLASDESRYVTALAMTVDAGQSQY